MFLLGTQRMLFHYAYEWILFVTQPASVCVSIFQLLPENCSGFDNNFRRPHKKCLANNLHTGRGFSLPQSALTLSLSSLLFSLLSSHPFHSTSNSRFCVLLNILSVWISRWDKRACQRTECVSHSNDPIPTPTNKIRGVCEGGRGTGGWAMVGGGSGVAVGYNCLFISKHCCPYFRPGLCYPFWPHVSSRDPANVVSLCVWMNFICNSACVCVC